MTFFRNVGVAVGWGALLAGPSVALAQTPPKSVGVIEMRLTEVPRIVTVPGRASANSRASIRPQVSGLVTEILYQPGTALSEGDPMFRIDPTTYEANLTDAQANLDSARAAVAAAQSNYNRLNQLRSSASVSEAQIETARTELEQAQASELAAGAALRLAEAQLAWTTITSPIDGMASVAHVSVGDLVTASQTDMMATVTQLDPINVDVYGPSVGVLSVLEDIEAGRLTIADEIHASLTLETGREYQATGELVAPGYEVSTTTGSIATRFRFDNPDRRLLPGMFVRARINVGVAKAFLVSQSAATRDRIGQLSAFVVEDGKAVRRDLTEQGTYQNNWIVTDGLADGDLLVVDGLTGLAPGADVRTVPVAFDANGVPRPVEPDAPADAADTDPASDTGAAE
ncbi:efflux RND transporter periplasmic adaptor subunit [Acuticoccus sp. M5D2P5]|uniref:efflux RND transporter periplasmic adaptor subunit n=1 Tax=Acuticoccus kalidii TaxID=2910977 RepID=UPI001F2D4E09|nr:efflux RND transporter periplasmic adaptor subunit [Acuticoccus kalidii]MCF3932750.1 efflux RND transporter periplasmic adaptor subunit [Acuticoccus kalidii]